MKKFISLLLTAVCLTSCAVRPRQTADTDGLKAAVLSSEDSVSAKNAYEGLLTSMAATLEADKLSAQNADLSKYNILYIDKSVLDMDANKQAIQEYVRNGGSVFLDNELYDFFDKDFIGAQDFVPLDVCPTDMQYPDVEGDIRRLQELILDFDWLYRNFANYEMLSQQNYGVGVIPSTAQVIAQKNGIGTYTLNQYGNGYVFFTNPLLPNNFSVNNLSEGDTGEYLSASTVGANKLIRDYFAEFVSVKKYGYAVEHVLGSFASPVASWELHYEDITGIEHGSAEIFGEMCRRYGQVPSFTLARSPYIWFRRAESVTYAINNEGKFAMDPYENAYSSGTHFVTGKEWLSLDYYDNTISYFQDSHDYIKRAYPCPIDWNGDGQMDLICGSSDGKLYYYEGSGMKTNYELGIATMFTDSEGNQICVDAFSSPTAADIDGDGVDEIVTGDESGNIHCFKRKDGMVLENQGVILETGMTDAMPSIGDLNGDGVLDMAVGSRSGEMRIYYGNQGIYSVLFDNYEPVDTGQSWCAPCIADADGDGAAELYAGTFEGYIAKFENNIFNGYIEGNECNHLGNINLKFGNNSVPRFYDIDGDGAQDLIAGSLEYGMAVPIDSEYFPYREKLQSQLDSFKEQGIYVGAHTLSHEHADAAHDARELEYQKKAFESYGLDWTGSGANQHTWRTSKIGYDTHYDNTTGYDGTYRSQFESGLYWNSGSQTPDSIAVPEVSAENSILVPFYLDNGQLMLQPCNVPNGNALFADISAKYGVPLLFYNHCDYVYREQAGEEEKIKKADSLVKDWDYNFVQENQLAKMTAAAFNTHVSAGKNGDTISFYAAEKTNNLPLYDKNYQRAAGVKVILGEGESAEEYNVNASVYYKKNNCIFMSLCGGASISKSGASDDIHIMKVNVPAKISKNNKGASIKFLEGGMMTAEVDGAAKTESDGWETTQQDGSTVFRKYGKADTLKIIR